MKPFILLLLASFLFTSCDQELSDTNPTDNTTLKAMIMGDDDDGKDPFGKGEAREDHCFELIYPVTVIMPDGSIFSGDEDNLWADVKAWYAINPSEKDMPNLKYPVDILWMDELTKTLANKDDLKTAKQYCGEKDNCYEMVYPITWTMPDGASAVMNDEVDWEAIKAWYTANPDSKEKPNLNYPVEVLLKDGTLQPILDETDMIKLKRIANKIKSAIAIAK